MRRGVWQRQHFPLFHRAQQGGGRIRTLAQKAVLHISAGTVPASADIAPFAVGLAKAREVKEMYKDWEIMRFQPCAFEDGYPPVPKHLHAANKIAARRPEKGLDKAL